MSLYAFLKYWDISLADESRLSADKGKNALRIAKSNVLNGTLSVDEQKALCDEWLRITGKKKAKGGKEESIPVLFLAGAFMARTERQNAEGKPFRVLHIPALMTPAGQLLPLGNERPWIAREYLAPNENHGDRPAVGEMRIADDWCSKNPLEDCGGSWADLIRWTFEFWKAVVGDNAPDGFEKLTDTELLAVPAPEPNNTTRAIRELLSDLLVELKNEEPISVPLIESLCDTKKRSASPPPVRRLSPPRGVMGCEHGLAKEQANAVNAMANLKHGQLLAVNGPPGTGKTTLLQSIIATETVRHMLDAPDPLAAEPAVIVGSSTNNQAVNNIIDSMNGAGPEEPTALWAKRWIPGVSSFGLYMPSLTRVQNGSVCTGAYVVREKDQWVGGVADLENDQDYLQRASEQWLENFKLTYGRETTSIGDGLREIQADIRELFAAFVEVDDALLAIEQEGAWLREKTGGQQAGEFLAGKRSKISRQKKLLTKAQAILEDACAPDGFIESIAGQFSFLNGWVNNRQRLRLREFAVGRPEVANLFCDDMAPATPATWRRKVVKYRDALQQEIKEEEIFSWHLACLNKALAKCRDTYAKLQERGGGRVGAVENLGLKDFEIALDITGRFEAFQKAMRFWEGRWLLEAEKILDGSVKTNGGRDGMEARFRRWCMLTPCLIVTLHTLPKVFQFKTGKNAGFVVRPMYQYIDLLIVDEAGQVAPHVGAVSFALAKKAVVVGDVYQIEPVVRVTPGTDYTNARSVGLDWCWDDSGIPTAPHMISEVTGAPQGSLMRLAQMATAFSAAHEENSAKKPAGVLLTEHRRCRKPMVDYCNKLVYGNELIPCREEKGGHLLPAFPWVHIWGNPQKTGGSWENENEAQAIVDWILKNHVRWTEHYGKSLADVLAVVAPFKAQTQKIKNLLTEQGLDGITVGTVHSLQGAERPIVIFSPTCSPASSPAPLFNRKPNLLNVAVSRARDSFVVVGDIGYFRGRSKTPSSVLGDFLTQENEIVIPTFGISRVAKDFLIRGERIDTRERHREVLRQALEDLPRGEQVVIASPWITMKAITDDNLAALVAATVKRGGKVDIVVDGEQVAKDAKDRSRHHKQPEQAIAMLTEAGAGVSRISRMHNKTLLVGSRELIEGSFNWLSANRLEGDLHARYDVSWRIFGEKTPLAIEEALKQLREIGAKV